VLERSSTGVYEGGGGLGVDVGLIQGVTAHAASPMVGGGFRQGVFDAGQLADSFVRHADVVSVLASYESVRLDPARQHVARSQRASRNFFERGLMA
jgi:2-polyprenyl-6-methoxyphenol hydroxylase-like FAD-dependent oxidoreductase